MSKLQQSLKIDNATASPVRVYVLRRRPIKQGEFRPGRSFQRKERVQQQEYDCKKCGRRYERAKCPAFGKICKKCGKKNHFAVGCTATSKPRNVGEVTTEDEGQFFVDSVSCETETSIWTQQLIKRHGSVYITSRPAIKNPEIIESQ